MSRRKKSSSSKRAARKKPPKPGRPAPASVNLGENRGAEALTVAWMLTTVATLLAEITAYVGWAIFAVSENARDWPPQFRALPGLLHFSAIVTGCLGLVLAFVVHRSRAVAIPEVVTPVAVLIGVVPMATSL